MSQEQRHPLVIGTCPHAVLHGVDILVINVSYTDEQGRPTRAQLDERFLPLLNEWQVRARTEEKLVPTCWTFRGYRSLCVSTALARANSVVG